MTRPFRNLSALQRIILGAMALGLVGGTVGAAVILRGTAPPPAYPASAAPLALGPHGIGPASPAANGVPLTVRIVIPAGGIDISVVQGDGVSVPMHLALHYPGTDQPGQGGNALYYAHAQPGMFAGLYKVHPGDAIEAVRSDGTSLVYTVSAVEKVSYNDRSVLDPTAYERITLLTCTSYNPFTPRLIVIGTIAGNGASPR